MKKTFCDRCNKELDIEQKNKWKFWEKSDSFIELVNLANSDTYELCQKCNEELLRFLKPIQ